MQIDLPIDIFTFPHVPLPAVWTVEQIYDTPALTVEQITMQARQAVDLLLESKGLASGATVAVGVGSRGLDNLVTIVSRRNRAVENAGDAAVCGSRDGQSWRRDGGGAN